MALAPGACLGGAVTIEIEEVRVTTDVRDAGAQPWLMLVMYQWVDDVEQRAGALRMRMHCLSIRRAWHNREWRRDQYLGPQLMKAVVGPSTAGVGGTSNVDG
jgi:hypothetical protein